MDRLFEGVYRYTVRDALDVSLALSAAGRVEDNPNLPGLAQVWPCDDLRAACSGA